ncbi:uncharacterized protein [Physcomitrium patens]|uniref:uncharacterized protein n=1 Tax=Physcomitrium patens TaxID=3218 RepID=UPI000D175389|nr:uncharacterized protein LOC112294242 [Physcomitrium patens]XP_024400285.1 uncharacterized protein LOC112294242 [Physcomitrium patens]XP_024400286.1 uncharacterized protein LOC112294242 [Physcomitrium patens]|eukprot:XP_024400284.1 uncharacterized protein LOC112294242 [Physcomitrella patens]
MNTYTSPYVLVMNVNKNENGIQGEGKLGKKGEGIGSADNDNEQNNANNDNYKTGGPAVQKHDYNVKMCCFKCGEDPGGISVSLWCAVNDHRPGRQQSQCGWKI